MSHYTPMHTNTHSGGIQLVRCNCSRPPFTHTVHAAIPNFFPQVAIRLNAPKNRIETSHRRARKKCVRSVRRGEKSVSLAVRASMKNYYVPFLRK